MPDHTEEAGKRIEKQLEKAIVSSGEGWGNAVPTTSGLLDSWGRHGNIDLTYRLPDGFALIELKWKSNDAVLAATQLMRYAATYMLYRCETELFTRFERNEMLRANELRFEVLAPIDYYRSDHDLEAFERFLDRELKDFCSLHVPGLKASFRYTSFPADFVFKAGVENPGLREAIRGIHSPFGELRVQGCAGQRVGSLTDWQLHGLPPDRAKHWKPGRSACELGRAWTRSASPQVPVEVQALLQSHPDMSGMQLHSGFIERQTPLPFSSFGPRWHDLLLLGNTKSGDRVVISIEAKADEPFDGTIEEKLWAVKGKNSRFPARVEWLGQYLFGESPFLDLASRVPKPLYGAMPYQLLSAVGGLCLEAERLAARKAVLIVHEFRTHLTSDRKMETNAQAFEDFFKHLWKANTRKTSLIRAGSLAGPLKMRSGGSEGVLFPERIRLYFGELRTDSISSKSA